MQAELQKQKQHMEAEARKLEAEKRQAQADLEEQKKTMEVASRKLEEEKRQAQADLEAQRQQAQADLERQKQQVEADLDAQKQQAETDLEAHRQQAQADRATAAVADLALDPGRLFLDPTLPPLGSGSSADTRRGTYRFSAKTDPTPVALKLFRGGHAVSVAVRDQIVHEIRIGARLQHVNLVQMFGTITIPGQGMVLVMELASGGSLRDVLSNRQGHPSIGWPVRLRLLNDIVQGMVKLHSLLPFAIIHRDLKSANVLLSSADLQLATAKICDFGLAKAVETVRTHASGGGLAGSLHWKAPETSRQRYSTKSDVYSFSILCFEVITRSMPFEDLNEPAIIDLLRTQFDPQAKNVLRLVDRGISVEEQRAEWVEDNPLGDRRPDLSLAEPGCPEALCALIRRCWLDEPAERPEFSECLAELEAIEREQTEPQPIVPQLIERPRTFANSHFKRAYDESGRVPVTHATQVLGNLVTFVHTYCQVHGLNSELEQLAATQFVERLQRSIAGHHGKHAMEAMLGEVGATAELLWTSAETFRGMREHDKEFCSLLNAAIRSDDAQLMPCTAALVRAINAL
jgi:serine/threonine protein kinase